MHQFKYCYKFNKRSAKLARNTLSKETIDRLLQSKKEHQNIRNHIYLNSQKIIFKRLSKSNYQI